MSLPEAVGRQSDVLYLPTVGHHVVLGSAGSGKTTMAIHRAAYLGNPTVPGHGQTLLLTFNRALVTYLRHLSPHALPNVTIEHYHLFARGYLAHRGLLGWNQILDDPRALIAKAVEEVRNIAGQNQLFDRPLGFFVDELEWLAGNGLFQLSDYLGADRLGRGSPLQAGQRRLVFEVFEAYRQLRAAGNDRYDWTDLASAVRAELSIDTDPRLYRHIVIDEGQDFSPEMIRSLVLAADPDGSVTLFADYAQQIYGRRMSWRSFGLNVGAVTELAGNYRNTKEIAQLAVAMADLPHFKDSLDLVVPANPTAAGPLPTLVRCANRNAELDFVIAQATSLRVANSVAVLFRDRNDERMFASRVSGAFQLHKKIRVWNPAATLFHGTYHSAKGMEFDYVILPFCGSDRLPDPNAVLSLGEEEALSRESRLLYVGVTRARAGLIITYSGTLTPLLPRASGLYVERSA